MENTYGIGVANRYALFLDDESDPLETLSLKEQEKELKKKTKVAEKENKKTEPLPKGRTTTIQKKTNKENTIHKNQDNKRGDDNKQNQRANIDGKPERNYNKFNNENREERNNRRNREDRTYNGPSENREREDRPPRRENLGDNYENRGNRGERGGRGQVGNKPSGPRGPRRTFEDRRGKREFDRQSGSDKTGVKPVDKRDGAGAHNWGSHKDVIEEADKANNDADQSWNENEKSETNAAPEQKEETEVENSPPVEEEPKELTLDEWKAQRAGRVKPQYNIRKAGEGEDPSQWKKMYELRKKDQESQESDDEEYDAAEYPQRVGRQKHVLDIDIQFNDNRRGGGGRGRGQRSGPRGSRPNQRGGGVGTGTGTGVGVGGGSGGNGREERGDRSERGERGERPDRRFRDDVIKTGDDRNEKRAPKVDDERDFPSLG